MLMLRQVGLLVIERSRKSMLFSDSIMGLSWMLLWMVSDVLLDIVWVGAREVIDE